MVFLSVVYIYHNSLINCRRIKEEVSRILLVDYFLCLSVFHCFRVIGFISISIYFILSRIYSPHCSAKAFATWGKVRERYIPLDALTKHFGLG